MYEIEFTRSSVKDLRSIASKDSAKVMEKIKTLSLNPYNNSLDIKKLKGLKKAYRFRVGDIRIIYEINDNKLVITIIKVAARGDVYG